MASLCCASLLLCTPGEEGSPPAQVLPSCVAAKRREGVRPGLPDADLPDLGWSFTPVDTADATISSAGWGTGQVGGQVGHSGWDKQAELVSQGELHDAWASSGEISSLSTISSRRDGRQQDSFQRHKCGGMFKTLLHNRLHHG